MQEWKLQEQTAEVEIAGVEKAGVDRTGGKCRSGKYGSENVWQTVRTENKNSHQLVIVDSTHPISKERLKLYRAVKFGTQGGYMKSYRKIKNHPQKGVVMVM